MLKKIKLIISFLFCFTFLFSYYTQQNTNVFFNGQKIVVQAPYSINNNRLCIPLNEFSSKVGLDYKKESTGLFVSDGNYRTVKFLTNHDQVMIGSTKYHMPDKTFYANQNWYAPLGYYAWYLGYTMNRTGNNYYVSKRLVDVSLNNEELRLKYSCNVSRENFDLKKERDVYTLELQNTVLAFPRKVLSSDLVKEAVIGQITTKPDLAKLILKSDKPLFVIKEGLNEVVIRQQGVADVQIVKEQIIPEDIDTFSQDKVSDKAVWIPSLERVSNIILSVKGNKTTLTGRAVYEDDKYLVPAEKLLLPFGYSFNVSRVGNLLVKYGDKLEVDTLVKAFIVNNETYVPLQEISKRLGFGLRWDYRIHTLFVNPIINDVAFVSNEDKVIISSYVEIEPKDVFTLINPDRIILDIPNAVLDVKEQIINVQNSNIQTIKAGQFDEETVRVVVQIKKPMNYGMSISDDGTKVSLQQSGFVDKAWYQSYDKYNLLSIYGDDIGKVNWEQKGNVLELDVANTTYKARNEYYFNDAFLEKIVGSQYSWDPVSSRMSIYFKEVPQIAVSQTKTRIDIRIDNSKGKVVYVKKQPIEPKEKPMSLKPLSGKKIVVESGHGGSDVGAVGIGGKYEKWFNLDTAHRIKDVLSSYGATVLMPIREDRFMSLSGRTQYANRNNADLYISVHFNSFINERARGISTYYYSNTSQPIASAVQKELVSGLGLRDNGIRQSRLFVLFHTQMPAILIEPGFLSNRTEYDMLLKAEYRDKIANAVGKGVVSYYKGK